MNLRFLLILSFFITIGLHAQELSPDFKTIQVQRKVNEYSALYNYSTPLRAFIDYTTILKNGQKRLLRSASTAIYKYSLPDSTTPDAVVSVAARDQLQNTLIREVITYRDSVAYVLSTTTEKFYSIRTFYLEHGRWVNAGEDGRRTLDEARAYVVQLAPRDIRRLQTYYAFSSVPSDTLAFVRYLQQRSIDPATFLLKKLKDHQLVLYGEVHRRKWSWDFLTRVATAQGFATTTGIVFLELPFHKQADMDRFLSKPTLDRDLLLNIFREGGIDGWEDRSMFDFIVRIWKRNQQLPTSKKIRIVLVDTPRPYSTLQNEEDLRKNERAYNRDSFMAATITTTLAASKSKRGALFVVGTGHVARTLPSAGALLSKQLKQRCYTIFTHAPEVDNRVHIPERLRHGVFDHAFLKVGNQPLAFDLKDSPFGKEPFDGLYYDASGSFGDNYDGYLFLGPLDTEPNAELLPDLYDDAFVKELDRRYRLLLGLDLQQDWSLKELSGEAVIESLRSKHAITRFDYLKPTSN